MESIEKKASSIELAIEEGLKEMGLTKEQVEVEVLSEKGLFKKAHVKITKKKPSASTPQRNSSTTP